MFGSHGKKKIVIDHEKLRKWNESSWKMSIYITFTALAFLAGYKERWFTDTR